MGRKVKKIFQKIFLGVFLFAAFFALEKVHAADYDLYVDSSVNESGDGSKDKPFEELEKAIEEASKGDKIYVFSGKYSGGFTIPKDVQVVGEDEDKVVISGPIEVNDDSKIENVTVSGGNSAITVKKDATFAIKKSIIRDAARIGVDVSPGNGKLIVEDSSFYNNGKAFYIQRGNKLELSNSAVYKNREEGVDVRDYVDGFIKNNKIYDNGESGIEIILGDTDMVISGNEIRDNEASGIATQYYEDFNGLGELVIKNNKVKDNSAFGIRCAAPSGGNPSVAYWDKSMTLDDNDFSENGEGKFSERCAVSFNQAEIKEIEAQKEELKAEQEKQAELERIKREEEEKRILKEKIEESKKKMENIENEYLKNETEISQNLQDIEKKSRFKYFFFGPGEGLIEDIERKIETSREKIADLRDLAENAPSEESKASVENKIISLEQSIANQEDELEEKRWDLGFWHRFLDLFRRKKITLSS